MSRESRLRNGSYEYAQINVNSASVDDLILRGNGFVRRKPNFSAFFQYERPRQGNWAYDIETEIFSGGLSGNQHIGYYVELEPKYFISDAFNLYLGLSATRSRDWLVWQRDNLIGSFERRNAELSAGFNWTLTNRQELRLKLQAIGLSANLRQAYRIDARGDAIESGDDIEDFSVRNLGVQLRYRYEMAPLSYIYVVYGRGGYRQELVSDQSGGLLGDSFSLRDDEQLLVKFSYRFER
jgi:opacity protein-like surface antigen